MSRRVMKPLFSMSHIWKNSWVFSTIVFCPTSPFPLTLASSLLPCLCQAVWADVEFVAPVLAHGAVNAAMVSLLIEEAFATALTWARYRLRCGGKRSQTRGASDFWTSEAFANVTDCHLLATTSLIIGWNLWERQECCVRTVWPLNSCSIFKST